MNFKSGWYDCPLSSKGKAEAEAAGKLLKANEFQFDIAYTSYLQRAIRTLWYVLEETELMYIPIQPAWQLNERYIFIQFCRINSKWIANAGITVLYKG